MVEEIKYVETEETFSCTLLKSYLFLQGGLIFARMFVSSIPWWIIFLPSITLLMLGIISIISLRKAFENENKKK